MSTKAELREDVIDCLEDVDEVASGKRRVVYELTAECRDCTTRRQARRKMRARIREFQEQGRFGINPATIVVLIQLGLAIWRLLKEIGWLSEATPEMIQEEVESYA